MTDLSRRVGKLEEAARPAGGLIVMWRHVGESNEAATDRWRKEHPGKDPDAADLKVIVVRWTEPPPSPGGP